jgi:hypothetical protein
MEVRIAMTMTPRANPCSTIKTKGRILRPAMTRTTATVITTTITFLTARRILLDRTATLMMMRIRSPREATIQLGIEVLALVVKLHEANFDSGLVSFGNR